MQSLWSQAAEAHICSSRVYIGTISRGATRRTSIRHGRLTSSETSTVRYTTKSDPSATSNTFDDRRTLGQNEAMLEFAANFKSRRPPLTMDTTGTRSRLGKKMAPMTAIQALNSICDTEEGLKGQQTFNRQLKYFLRGLHRAYDPHGKLSPNWHAEYRGPSLGTVQLAVDQEQRQDSMPSREPISSVQFENYHNMINKLVDRLIIQSYYDEYPKDPDLARRNVESLDSAWTAIRLLRSDGYPRYNHPSADPEACKQARDDLADKIRMLFDAWATENPGRKAKFQVAKMCYNLLVCPVPPSMHHYNLLLLGFSRKAAYNLADIVAESFLEHSRLLPTPQTIVCLLIHYRIKRDIVGFFRIIRRMMALDNRGILIRRRWYEDVVKIPSLHQWARQPEVTTSLQANWIIQRPSRGQDIYEQLVSGLLAFDRVKDAAKVFIGSLQEKMGVSTDLFVYLLKSCCYSLDVSAAEILSRGLVENVDVTVSLLLRDDCPRKLVQHLYPVLKMGDPPSYNMSARRAQMIREATTLRTNPRDTGNVQRIGRAMFIRHNETYLYMLEKKLRRFAAFRRVRGPLDRIIVAESCINALTDLEDHLGKLSGTLLKIQTLQSTVRKLEEYTWDLGLPENLADVRQRVVTVLGNRLPQPGEVTGDAATEVVTLDTLADHWIHYRLAKVRGIMSDTGVFRLHSELVYLTGRRLIDDIVKLLHRPENYFMKTLDLSKPVAQPEDGHEDQRETATETDSLWPRAEAGAVWAG